MKTKHGGAQFVHLAIFGFSAAALAGIALLEMQRNGWFRAEFDQKPETAAWRFPEKVAAKVANNPPDEWECTEIVVGEGSRSSADLVIWNPARKVLAESPAPTLEQEMAAWREGEADRERRNVLRRKRTPQKWIPPEPSPEEILKERRRQEDNRIAATVKARLIVEQAIKNQKVAEAERINREERRKRDFNEVERRRKLNDRIRRISDELLER